MSKDKAPIKGIEPHRKPLSIPTPIEIHNIILKALTEEWGDMVCTGYCNLQQFSTSASRISEFSIGLQDNFISILLSIAKQPKPVTDDAEQFDEDALTARMKMQDFITARQKGAEGISKEIAGYVRASRINRYVDNKPWEVKPKHKNKK